MKNLAKLKLILILGIYFFILEIKAQEILWTYHLTSDEENYPNTFWEDKEGNITFNLHKKRDVPREVNSSEFRENFVLRLTKEGKFNGVMYRRNCENRTSFMPFKDKYLTHGPNCLDGTNKYSYDFRLFDQKGNLIRIGESLKHYNQRIYFGSKKTKLFSKKNDAFNYDELFVGKLNKKLKVKYRKLSIGELALEGHGMRFSFNSPVKIGKSHYVIPINYGVTNKSQRQTLRMKYGGFFTVNKNKLSWKFILKKLGCLILEIESYESKVIALFSSNHPAKKYLKIFNSNGDIVQDFEFVVAGNKVYDMKIHNGDIVLLTSNQLVYYSFDGTLIKSIDLPKMESANGIEICMDNSILVAGRKDKKTFVMKIGFKKKEETVEEVKNEIKYSLVSTESEEVSSVSIFPNPTAEVLNFNIVYDKKINIISKCFIEVLDLSGKQVIKQAVDLEGIQLDVSRLISGTYFYRVLFDDSEYLTGQFVKI